MLNNSASRVSISSSLQTRMGRDLRSLLPLRRGVPPKPASPLSVPSGLLTDPTQSLWTCTCPHRGVADLSLHPFNRALRYPLVQNRFKNRFSLLM